MPICVVQGCHYRRGQKSRKQLKFEKETGQMVTLHRFPKDPTRRLMWTEALAGWVDRSTDNSFICSTHFTDDCWEQSSVNRRLKTDAIPTLFPQGLESTPVSRKRRRMHIKEEIMEPEPPPVAEETMNHLTSREVGITWDKHPEVLLTELHRVDPVIPTYAVLYEPYAPQPTDVVHY